MSIIELIRRVFCTDTALPLNEVLARLENMGFTESQLDPVTDKIEAHPEIRLDDALTLHWDKTNS